MVGEEPRGHIFPSSWLNPSGELTIYVPTEAKRTPMRISSCSFFILKK